jgi:hypothetical protein
MSVLPRSATERSMPTPSSLTTKFKSCEYFKPTSNRLHIECLHRVSIGLIGNAIDLVANHRGILFASPITEKRDFHLSVAKLFRRARRIPQPCHGQVGTTRHRFRNVVLIVGAVKLKTGAERKQCSLLHSAERLAAGAA